MTPMEKLLALLADLERKGWCGELRVTFHGGEPVEINRSEQQKLFAPQFQPGGPLFESR